MGSSSSKRKVLCLGDSLTHGTFAYDWISKMNVMFPEVGFYRDAKNGCQVGHILRRMHSPFHSYPDTFETVIVFVGTNDLVHDILSVNGESFFNWYYPILNKPSAIDWEPSLHCFTKDYEQIISNLMQKKEVKKIICVSIPPLGEGIDSPTDANSIESMYNKKIVDYRNAIKSISGKFSEKAVYIPLGEEMEVILRDLKSRQKESTTTTTLYKFKHIDYETLVTDFKVLVNPMLYAYINKKVYGTSFKDYGDADGRYFLHDDIHFNERGGDILINLLKEHTPRL